MANTAYTQEHRPMVVRTPLDENVLLLQGFLGHEGISELFSYQLDVLSVNDDVAFDKLLGQKVTVDLVLPEDKQSHFSGICVRVSQGARDETFTAYRLEIVPKFWLLTRRFQSRIFQNMSVPDILKEVLTGLDVDYQIQGTFHPRTFCVQYRETDFDFASRLMEEEGIFYFFKHNADGHQMVVTNTSQSHPDVPEYSKVIYEEFAGGTREEDRIHRWEKFQELRSGKYTLWDHAFELPHKNLEATTTILDSISVGKVTHKLRVAGNDNLELYDYPGEYARRFEGGDRPEQIQKVFQDNRRTVDIRIQQEEMASLVIHGASTCGQFAAGHKFTLERHFNADGVYVLAGVQHAATYGGYRSGEEITFSYSNTFTCIPLALPFRPPSKTPRPVVQGTQTAVVVGPPGEEIYTDKYGRVKVQFHWDREGKKDHSSSCWIRVSQPWGGGNWGGMFIPHVGQEVIVSFLEGDPDRPLITGRVYNPEMMPPLELPANKTKSVIRDHGGNEIIMEGEAGNQQIRLYAPKHDTVFTLGNSFHWSTGGDAQSEIKGNQHAVVFGNSKINILAAQHDSTLGARSRFIGGLKNEIIVGIETKVNAGNKTELIAGGQIKVQKGKLLELKGVDRYEKCPRIAKLLGSVLYKASQLKNNIQGAVHEKIGGMRSTKAAQIKQASKNWIGSFEAKAKIDTAKLLEKAEKHEVKATNAKLRASVYKVLAKMDVKDGALVVK